jgi:hypothetical protein
MILQIPMIVSAQLILCGTQQQFLASGTAKTCSTPMALLTQLMPQNANAMEDGNGIPLQTIAQQVFAQMGKFG